MKKFIIIVALISIIAVCCTLVACKTNPAEVEPNVGDENAVPVSDAMNVVYEAMKHACTTDGATEGIYVAFNGEKRVVDSSTEINSKAILYDFSTKAYISADNLSSDTKSTLAFTVKQENGSALFSMYYANGLLYIDYPPIFNKVAIDGLELGNIVNELNKSKAHDGKVKTVADLLPVLGNYIFTSCKRVVLGKCEDSNCNCKNHYEYVCALDFSKLYDAFESVLTNAKLGIDADMLLGALNLTKSDLNHLSTLKTTMTFNVFNTRGGDDYYYFKSVSLDQKETTVTDTISLKNFVATEFTEAVAGDYKVILADNLTNYRKFDFANNDVQGTLTLSVSSSSSSNTIFNQPIRTELVKNAYSCNYSLKSNYNSGVLTFDLVLSDLFGTGKGLELYFDGADLYVDLSDYLGESGTNLGKYKFSKDFIESKLTDLSLLTSKVRSDGSKIAYAITSLLSYGNHTADSTELVIEKDVLDMFANAIGYDFALDYQSAKITLDTTSNLFKSASLELVSQGFSLGLTCNNPKIGYEVLVEKPDWTSSCVAWSDISRLTPVVKGSIQTNINGVSNLKLVESLISSLTGAQVELTGSVAKFVAESNYSTDGELQIFKLGFYGSDNSFVCSLYYRAYENDVRSNSLYVILPQENGKDKVLTLKMLENSRYSGLLSVINGNALVVSGSSDVVLGNDSSGLKLTANRDGVASVLALIKKVFPKTYLSELPIDFAIDHITMSFGSAFGLSTTFGQNKHIDLDIEDITVDYYSLGVKTTELTGHKDRTVSIFDDNDLSETVTIQMYGKTETSLVLSVADFGGWKYESIPSLGQGLQTVNAYLNIFGQKVIETIKVDCSEASEYAVKCDYEYLSYVDNENKAFIFSKYASPVDPVFVLSQKFNSVDLYVGGQYVNKQVDWTYSGVSIKDATFGYGNVFTVTPNLTGFFGKPIALASCSYSLRLSEDEVDKIENSDNLLTIWAYDEFNPLDEATYLKVAPYILTKSGDRFFQTLVWDVDSIQNVSIRVNGKLLGNEELINALANNFYSLDGKYKIYAYIKNALGVSAKLDAVITVENRIITEATLSNLADGVEFESITDENVKGVIVLDTAKINSLTPQTAIAKEINCSYGAITKTERTFKWEIPVVKNVSLYSETPIQGDLAVIIGDSVGGFQTFTYRYIFKTYKVNDIALTNGDKVIDTKAVSSSLTVFELLNENPYNFDFPTGVVLSYADFVLTYNGFSKTYPAGSLTYKNIDWGMTTLDMQKIWYVGENTVYQGSFQVADKKIELHISFVQAVVDDWKFLDEEGNVYSPDKPLLTTPTYKEVADGEFALVDGKFVRYTSELGEVVRYSLVPDVTGNVYYKTADASDNVLSLTLDPNKTNYLCYDSYPKKAKVTFKNIVDGEGNPVEFVLDINWDLTPLYQSTTIQSKGFYDTLRVNIAYGQRLADVHMWISGKDPSDYNFIYNSDGSVYSGDEADSDESLIKTKIISLQLLNTDAIGKLFLSDLNDPKTIHDAICGCGSSDCLGRIYFNYADENTQNGWFEITEWVGLEKIGELYKTQLANGVAVNEVSGKITVTVKVGNIVCSAITISIESCPITSPSYEDYLPLANSSIDNAQANVYSMKAIGSELTIDPYLANVKDGNYYPQKVSFFLNGKKTVAKLDGWDTTCFDGVEVYKGASGTTYALIETVFGNVRIASETTVLSRIIELVFVDGNSSPIINVNVYADNPFGESVAVENSKTIAYKRVEVKFAEDDSRYPMVLKYDVSGLSASHSGGVLARNIEVYVGNDAGGYQKRTGYSVYSTQNTVESISTDNQAILEAVSDGIIYTDSDGFIDFDSLSESDSALVWKSLLVNVETLKVKYSYYANGAKVTKEVIARKNQSTGGMCFAWGRDENDFVVLKLWNNNSSVVKEDNVLTLSTRTNKKVKLTESDFTLSTVVLSRVFEEGFTVDMYLSANKIYSVPSSMISADCILVEIVDKDGKVLEGNTVLNAGTYSLRLRVTDDRFVLDGTDNAIVKELVVAKKEVSELTIMNGDRRIFVSSKIYEIYEGSVVALACSSAYNFEISITVTDDFGNVVTEPEAVGIYTVVFESNSDNYTIIDNTYTLVIKARESTEEE